MKYTLKVSERSKAEKCYLEIMKYMKKIIRTYYKLAKICSTEGCNRMIFPRDGITKCTRCRKNDYR